MRRTFCARCHTIGLSRCAHPTRSSGPGGKHRARETYRVHPARTFVDVPTSPFLFSAATTTTEDALPDSFTTLTSTRVATDESDEQFTTLMHELWSAPSESVGELPKPLTKPVTPATETFRRTLMLIPVVLLILGGIGWRSYQPGGIAGSSPLSAETVSGVRGELRALPETVSDILESGTPGSQLSDSATSLTRWSEQVSALMSASVTLDSSEVAPADAALIETAGTSARALQMLLSDALSTRLIVGALDLSPDLPDNATTEEIGDLRTTLTLATDNARTRLSLLPTSSAEIERQLLGVITSMERDHSRLLVALDSEDSRGVAEALESLRASHASIGEMLSTYLGVIRPVADQLLVDLEGFLKELS